MDINKVGVVGGGIMGHNIAILIARERKVPVVIKEANSDLAVATIAKVHAHFDVRLGNGKYSRAEVEMGKALITATDSFDDLKDADLVIEAVTENMAIKKEIFSTLDAILAPHAILASNTSSLSIAELASGTKRPDKFAGLHFFNPPMKMPLVELVRTPQTSKETLETLQNFTESLGKTIIRVADVPGFLVNRLLLPYLNTAAKFLETTALTPEQIDEAAMNAGWPVGPFLLMDFVGIDVGAAVAEVLYKGYGERMKPSEILRLMVVNKRFGKKNGIGFYLHETEGTPIADLLKQNFPNRANGNADEAVKTMMLEMALEAKRCVTEGVADENDIEIGCALGIHFPDGHGGPLGWGRENGLFS
mgnify:CR=1 FL=1